MEVVRVLVQRCWSMRLWGEVACGALLLIKATAALASPIVDYTFNETGNSAPSIGADKTPVYFTNSNGQLTDLHGAPGSGVTGGLNVAGSDTDRASDNTASTGM